MILLRWIKDKLIYWLTANINSNKSYLCHFDTLQSQVEPCDVLLVQGRSRVSGFIQTITQSTWSHSLLYLGISKDIKDPLLKKHIAQNPKLTPNMPLIAESELGLGTVIRPLSDYQQEHLRICRPRGLRAVDRDKILATMANQLGKQYNISHIVALLLFLMPYRLLPRSLMMRWFYQLDNDTAQVICSAMIADAFNQVNFPILPSIEAIGIDKIALIKRNASLYTPADFDVSPYFAIIKYPMFEVSGHLHYHDLPWKTDSSQVSPREEEQSHF